MMVWAPRFATLVAALLLTACGVQDCIIDVSHRDCPVTRPAGTFPQDDASCRSYGLTPGTRDYQRCRGSKAHVHGLSKDETDYGYLRNPLLPDLH